MNRFITRLKEAASNEQPMGFRKAASRVKGRMALIADLSHMEKAEGITEYIEGADALICPSLKFTENLPAEVREIPRGIRLGNRDETAGSENEVDFVLLPLESPVTAVPDSKETGKVLELGINISEGPLKAVNLMPVDAVMVAAESKDGFLTWYELVHLRRISSLLSLPLLFEVDRGISAAELKAVWEAGVDGAVLKPRPDGAKDTVKILREAVAGFPARSQGHRSKGDVFVRYPGEKTEEAAEIEEEEEFE